MGRLKLTGRMLTRVVARFRRWRSRRQRKLRKAERASERAREGGTTAAGAAPPPIGAARRALVHGHADVGHEAPDGGIGRAVAVALRPAGLPSWRSADGASGRGFRSVAFQYPDRAQRPPDRVGAIEARVAELDGGLGAEPGGFRLDSRALFVF